MKNIFARDPKRTSLLEKSYIVQRQGMALLGALFPIAFLLSSYLFGRTDFQTSISAYYWTLDLERNFFVGVLCAIGVFFLLYKGYSTFEDRVLDLAGISAVGIAFVPMVRDSDCASAGTSAHGMFAVLFFACISLICILMSYSSQIAREDPERAKQFRPWYMACSAVMIGSVAVAVLSRLLPTDSAQWLCEHGILFWVEAFAVWAFSAFWFLKTRELDPSMSWIPFRRKRKAQVAK